MALKAILSKLEEAPEAVRSFYKKDGDKFVLDVDGMVTDDEHEALNTKVAEFRDSNIALKKENDAIKKQFEGVDPAEHRSLKDKVAKIEAQGVKSDNIDAVIQSAVEKATTPLTTRLESIERERNEAQAKLVRKDLEDQFWAVGDKAGVAGTAKIDFLRRVSDVWQNKDGQLVAMQGEKALFSKRKGKAGEPLSPEEWVIEWLPNEAGHLFKASNGAGAQNNNSTKTANGSRLIANTQEAVSMNLEALARGEVVVQGTSA